MIRWPLDGERCIVNGQHGRQWSDATDPQSGFDNRFDEMNFIFTNLATMKSNIGAFHSRFDNAHNIFGNFACHNFEFMHIGFKHVSISFVD